VFQDDLGFAGLQCKLVDLIALSHKIPHRKSAIADLRAKK
jgi:hypothetical protein